MIEGANRVADVRRGRTFREEEMKLKSYSAESLVNAFVLSLVQGQITLSDEAEEMQREILRRLNRKPIPSVASDAMSDRDGIAGEMRGL